jgi:putative phosphoesterase
MKILLFSDSHGNTNNILKAMKKNKDIDIVIHLGDFIKDMDEPINRFKEKRFELVSGNNDWRRELPSEKMLYIEGKKIFITHGHHYNVKNEYQRIINKGNALCADAVFFGHTHMAEELFCDKMLVLNPGSIGLPSGTRKTYCVVEIRDNRFWPSFESVKD